MAVCNINNLDPVQGLVDYVLNIKPFHTKILEILVEYVFQEPINVTILEDYNWVIGFKCGPNCVFPIIAVDADENTITIHFNFNGLLGENNPLGENAPVDLTRHFPPDTPIKIIGSFDNINDRIYTVQSTFFDTTTGDFIITTDQDITNDDTPFGLLLLSCADLTPDNCKDGYGISQFGSPPGVAVCRFDFANDQIILPDDYVCEFPPGSQICLTIERTDIISNPNNSGEINYFNTTYLGGPAVFLLPFVIQATTPDRTEISIYVNGVKRREIFDYTITLPSTITFVSPLLPGDVLDFVGYEGVPATITNGPLYHSTTALANGTNQNFTLPWVIQVAGPTELALMIYVNGVLLTKTSYTTTPPFMVMINDFLTIGDIIEFHGDLGVCPPASLTPFVALPDYSTVVYAGGSTVFLLPFNLETPPVGVITFELYINGVRQLETTNYTITYPNTITIVSPIINGDRLDFVGYTSNCQISDTATTTVIDNTCFTVDTIVLDPANALTTCNFGDPITVITLVEDLNYPPLLPNQSYGGYVNPGRLDIIEAIPYSNIFPRPSNPDESAFLDIPANMFVVDGNFACRFCQGYIFDVVGGMDQGKYTALYSDFVAGQTRIRVIEDIPVTGPGVGGQIKRHNLGYSEHREMCCNYDELCDFIRVVFRERLQFGEIHINLHDDIIAYNLENTGCEGYDELPYSGLEPAVGAIGVIGQQIYLAGPGQTVFNLTTAPPVPGSNPVFLSVTVGGVPAGFILNSATQFTITSPAVNEDDLVVATVKDMINTEMNAIVNPFGGCLKYSFYHFEVLLDIPNNRLFLYGGNFIQRFTTDRTIEGFNLTGPTPGLLGTWKPTSFNIIDVTSALSQMTIPNDLTWLFIPDAIFEVKYFENNTQAFQVVSSAFIGGNTVLTVSPTPFETILTTQNYYTKDRGIITGAVYYPSLFTTAVVVETPLDPDIEQIGYIWIGPMQLHAHFSPTDLVANVGVEGLGISDRLVTVPDSYNIIFTDDVNDCFTIMRIDPITLVPVDLSDSFTPGTMFRVMGSFNNINNRDYTVQSVSFNSFTGETIICVVEDILDDTLPYGRIVREPTIVADRPSSQADTTILESLQFSWTSAIDWFQFMVIAADTVLDTFTLLGNALASIQPGEEIELISNNANAGIYTVVTRTLVNGNTLISVTSNVPVSLSGGFVEPVGGLGATLRFNDIIGVQIEESADGAFLGEGPITGFDEPFFDVGSFDEGLEELIHLYGNIF